MNPYWFTYNQLSQITPLPVAWDITSAGAAAGSGGCSAAAYGTADAKCNAVYTFLSKQSGYDPANPHATNNSLATYATNPIWQVVDGPWKLSSFDASGNASFVPNKSYSGSPKPTLAKFTELPFTTDDAEFNALVGGHVNFGYLPLQDVTKATTNPLVPAANNPRLSDFTLAPLYTWSINYFPENFNSTGDDGNAGAIWKQLYIRQAFQRPRRPTPLHQQDRQGLRGADLRAGSGDPGQPLLVRGREEQPLPLQRVQGQEPALEPRLEGGARRAPPPAPARAPGPTSAGRTSPPGPSWPSTCSTPAATRRIDQLMNTEKSSWAQAGFNITLSQASFDTVIGNATTCTPSPSCTWELENWGAGWVYAPDYYPTGEEIFSTGAGSNSG